MGGFRVAPFFVDARSEPPALQDFHVPVLRLAHGKCLIG